MPTLVVPRVPNNGGAPLLLQTLGSRPGYTVSTQLSEY